MRMQLLFASTEISAEASAPVLFTAQIWKDVVLLVIPLIIGAVLTYISKPLIERRIARIRVTEKIVDANLVALNRIWTMISVLDKSKVFHEPSYTDQYVAKYPFAQDILAKEVNIVIVQKVFLTYDSFRSFSNNFATEFVSQSITFDNAVKDSMRELYILTQYLIHIFAIQVVKIDNYNSPGFDNPQIKEKLKNLYVFDVGVICFSDVKRMLAKIEGCLMKSYYNPPLKTPKRPMSSGTEDYSCLDKCVILNNIKQLTATWDDIFLSDPHNVAVFPLPTE